jgi:hypothetical protein
MALEVRYVKRVSPRVRARRAKASVPGKLVAAEKVLDISSEGVKLVVRGRPPEKGSVLALELVHPALERPLVVEGVVRWVRPDESGPRFNVGLQFSKTNSSAQKKLEQLITLELGSAVTGVRGQVGWVAPAAEDSGLEGLFFVYDLTRTEVATILDEKDYLQATRIKGAQVLQRQGTSFEGLLRWVFDLEGVLLVAPPPG